MLLTFVFHAERHVYTLSLLFLLPSTGICVFLPLLLHSAITPFLQGFLLLPLLLFPLSIPIRTLQRSWVATARELGANKMATLRLFWWPLLQKPVALSLFLSIIISIVQ
ncbi:MAG: spermidine/putrescine ABC transporter permease [Acetobacter sp.]